MIKDDNFAEEFIGLDLSNQKIENVEFEACTFTKCDFSNASFKKCRFLDCKFEHCDLSLISVLDSLFSGDSFVDCKLIGVDWSKARWDALSLVALSSERCLLSDSSFWGLKLRDWKFLECILKGVDFRESDMQEVDFKFSNLSGTLFRNTNLKKADLTNTTNFDIDLKTNDIKEARFSRYEAIRLLGSLDIVLED